MTSLHQLHNKLSAATVTLALLLSGCGGATAIRPVEEKAAVTESVTPPGAAAVEFDPRLVSDYTMGVNTYKAGNLKTSESIFFAMSKAHPELAGPHANLGTIYSDKGELDKAEVEFNQALTLKPDQPEIYNQLGILYRNKGQFEKALANYQQGLKLAPDNPNLRLNLGILYDLYLNQPQAALEEWQHYKSVVGEDKQVDIWIADVNQRIKAK